MTSERSYNGWTNYETWCVKLWIDNDQGSHEYWRERAEFHASEAKPTHELAQALEEGHRDEDVSPDLDASVYSDLLSAALGSVNWHEIAASLLEDAREISEAEA